MTKRFTMLRRYCGGSGQRSAERVEVRLEALGWHGRRIGIREREGPARPWVVGVAGNDVRVEMGHRVAQHVVVELDRGEGGLDRAADAETSRP
jgi:hypothetical protein